jgi:hypothetical protein
MSVLGSNSNSVSLTTKRECKKLCVVAGSSCKLIVDELKSNLVSPIVSYKPDM